MPGLYPLWYIGSMDDPVTKPLRWVGSSRDDVRKFPQPVRQVMGTALYFAQVGTKYPSAKPLKGIVKGAGVLEIVDDHDGDTYRTVYTVRFAEAVFVLHAFQKKATKGIKTPAREIALIRSRYEEARRLYEAEFSARRKKS